MPSTFDAEDYYSAQWQELRGIIESWDELVAKSEALMTLHGDERYREMAEDVRLHTLPGAFRGTPQEEHGRICEACRVLVRHIGKIESGFGEMTWAASMVALTEQEAEIFKKYEQDAQRIIRKYRPNYILRIFRLYDKQARMQAMGEELRQLFTRIINDAVQELHQDYRYESTSRSRFSWIQSLWDRHVITGSLAAVQEIRERFFMDDWKETQVYAQRLSETINVHLKAARKLLRELKAQSATTLD